MSRILFIFILCNDIRALGALRESKSQSHIKVVESPKLAAKNAKTVQKTLKAVRLKKLSTGTDTDASYFIDTKSVQIGGFPHVNIWIFNLKQIIFGIGTCPQCFQELDMKLLRR